jgi:hypothetical protein
MSVKQYASRLLVGLLLVIPLASCATSTVGQPTGTGSPTLPTIATCSTTATATAHSWVDSNRQISGSINGGPVGPISNFVYPLGLQLEDVFSPTRPGFTTWTPDGKHLATLVEVAAPGVVFSYPYVVDTASHAVTQVHLPSGMLLQSPIEMEWTRERSIAWADNNTLLIFAASPNEIGGPNASQTTSYRYNISTQTLTALPGVTSALQGTVRCGTLYYLELLQMKQFQVCQQISPTVVHYWYVGGASLRRYNLAAQAPIGQPYPLGNTSSCPQEFDGEADAMGWDVTSNGKTLVYQRTTVSSGSLVGQSPFPVKTASMFMVVDFGNPGSPTQILVGATSNANAFLAIAPDQKQVAVVATDTLLIGNPSNALVYTGTLNGGAASAHDPSAGGLPAWTADSKGFDTSGLWSEIPGVDFPKLEQWQIGMPHAIASIDGEHHPASLP